jgi:hypothetical protein
VCERERLVLRHLEEVEGEPLRRPLADARQTGQLRDEVVDRRREHCGILPGWFGHPRPGNERVAVASSIDRVRDADPMLTGIELSVVIPCLNEEKAIATVVEQAHEALGDAGIAGEVIVVDNASDDRSAELARAAGATVVYEPRRGYGSAYLAGFAAARGTYILMSDADGTYPLEAIPAFVEKLRDGAELVMGSRFRGQIEPGAMPWTNRYIGNPVLNGMLNVMFHCDVSDAHCGLRAVRRDALPALGLSATGMEFASVVLAILNGLGDPWTGVSIAFAMLSLVGLGVVQLGLYARTYAVIYLGEPAPRLERMWRRFRLEDGLLLAAFTFVVGTAITAVSLFDGVKDPRLGTLGLTLMAFAFQGVFSAFFLSILGLSEHAVLRRRSG